MDRRALALAAGAVPGDTTVGECYYCPAPVRFYWPCRRDGMPGAWVHITGQIDHVVPLFRGGSNDLTNLVIACESCNKSKGWRFARPAGAA